MPRHLSAAKIKHFFDITKYFKTYFLRKDYKRQGMMPKGVMNRV